MTLEELIKNEIQSIENQKQVAWIDWKIKDSHSAGRVDGLRKAQDLIEKAKT